MDTRNDKSMINTTNEPIREAIEDSEALQLVRKTGFQHTLRCQVSGKAPLNFAEVSNVITFDEDATVRNVQIVKIQFNTLESGKQLAQLVKDKKITKLNLYDCEISDNAVEAFSNELLEGTHTLYCLELDGAGVTENTLKKYRTANPESPFAVVCVMENQNDEQYWHLDGDYKAKKLPKFTGALSLFAVKVIVDNNIATNQLTESLKNQIEIYKAYESFRKQSKN